MIMTWEEKFAACNALSPIELLMRKPGDWYVHHDRVEIRDSCISGSGCVTGATTPQEAVEKHWDFLTKLNPGERIVVRAGDHYHRKEFKWNGFMWEQFPQEEVECR